MYSVEITEMCLPNVNKWNVPGSAATMLPRIVEVWLLVLYILSMNGVIGSGARAHVPLCPGQRDLSQKGTVDTFSDNRVYHKECKSISFQWVPLKCSVYKLVTFNGSGGFNSTRLRI